MEFRNSVEKFTAVVFSTESELKIGTTGINPLSTALIAFELWLQCRKMRFHRNIGMCSDSDDIIPIFESTICLCYYKILPLRGGARERQEAIVPPVVESLPHLRGRIG